MLAHNSMFVGLVMYEEIFLILLKLIYVRVHTIRITIILINLKNLYIKNKLIYRIKIQIRIKLKELL